MLYEFCTEKVHLHRQYKMGQKTAQCTSLGEISANVGRNCDVSTSRSLNLRTCDVKNSPERTVTLFGVQPFCNILTENYTNMV